MSSVCGELSYSMGVNALPIDSVQFLKYLSDDKCVNIEKSQHKKKMEQLRTLKKIAQSPVTSSNVVAELNYLRENALLQCEAYYHSKLEEIRKIQTDSDVSLMKSVLSYGNICRNEVEKNRLAVRKDLLDCLERQEFTLDMKNILRFAHHIRTETHNSVDLTVLPASSPQDQRCRKAVTDNIKSNVLFDMKVKSFNVENVMKLDHRILLQELEKASQGNESSSSAGKVKGLFCSLSLEEFYSFCAFGVGSQAVTRNSGSTTSTTRKAASIRDKHVKLLESTLFHKSVWYYYPIKARGGGKGNNAQIPSRLNSLEQTVVAEDPGCALTQIKSILNKNCESSQKSAFLRFYKHSSPSNMMDSVRQSRSSPSNGSTMLALCRVYMNTVKIVSEREMLTDEEIMEIYASGKYDSIYIQKAEEYILLQPLYVLPEFFMYLTLEFQNSSELLSEDVNKCLSEGGLFVNSAVSEESNTSSVLLDNEVKFSNEVLANILSSKRSSVYGTERQSGASSAQRKQTICNEIGACIVGATKSLSVLSDKEANL